MKQEKQRIAIAEACGPKLYMICKPIHAPFCYYRPNAKGYTNNTSEAWKVTAEEAKKHVTGKSYEGEPDRVISEPAPLPDYLNDLNAMHEAEKILNEKQAVWYLQKLTQVRFKAGVSGMIGCMIDKTVFATASQRAEAFLRTIGKWEDGE